MKFIFKWALRLFLLLIVLAVVAVLSIDPICRVIVQNRIREQTGMDAQIGKFSVGLLSPTLTIRDLKLYNPPDFGGTLFLDIPEIHAEYDRAALAKSDLRVTLLRFNLAELDIVKNQSGQTNIFSLAAIKPPKKGDKAKSAKTISFTKETGLEFKGVDVLNVSIGKFQFIDLNDQKNNRSQDVGISNLVMKNVKSPTDLAGLGLLVGLKSGDFFNSLVDTKNPAVLFK